MLQKIILFLRVLAITTYAIMLDMINNISRIIVKFVFSLLSELLLFLRFLDYFFFVVKFIHRLFFSWFWFRCGFWFFFTWNSLFFLLFLVIFNWLNWGILNFSLIRFDVLLFFWGIDLLFLLILFFFIINFSIFIFKFTWIGILWVILSFF